MKTSAVEAWIWVLVYGGLLVLVLGLAVRSREGGLAIVLIVVGAVTALAGALLVWVRSRMHDDDGPAP